VHAIIALDSGQHFWYSAWSAIPRIARCVGGTYAAECDWATYIKLWLQLKKYFEIILKLLQRFISHVTASETETNYFGR